MTREGQVVLFRFPQTDQTPGKLRPALIVREVPSSYGDWLICMISSRLTQEVTGLDEVIGEGDADFTGSGLKAQSLVRVSRIAVVDGNILLGSIGSINSKRLSAIKKKLADWILAP